MWETRNIPLWWKKKIHIYPQLVHTSVNLLILRIDPETWHVWSQKYQCQEYRTAQHKFSQHIFRIYHHPARSSLCRPYTGRTIASLDSLMDGLIGLQRQRAVPLNECNLTKHKNWYLLESFGGVIFVCGRRGPLSNSVEWVRDTSSGPSHILFQLGYLASRHRSLFHPSSLICSSPLPPKKTKSSKK